MIKGLRAGRTLIQEEWADPAERQAVHELEAEGLITRELLPFERYQCEAHRIRWKNAD
ncbi:hypothetical protein [Methylobacterium nodulans]|uniref:Uncharacterized protein n=1 Tax=Methylobacterium nodulans (strain LMG 21967 / CNCM I-2342 / ORS 2060) TaxID=460265 RepID=B8ISJ9_METNO|nr:hypothetical protein [Methylobacterium nodulans]ACL58839.1 hypothetical protein Mnod_3947 [Methylobacterium nodulans ORS 2060]